LLQKLWPLKHNSYGLGLNNCEFESHIGRGYLPSFFFIVINYYHAHHCISLNFWIFL
jgi:hypothetical protein